MSFCSLTSAGEERSLSRYLLVPADEELLSKISGNKIALRDALTAQSWAWLVDSDGQRLTEPVAVNPKELPPTALPKEGVRLSMADKALLRVRMIGADLTPHHVPASVVKKMVDGVMGAVRTLSAKALRLDSSPGRPDDQWRRYYDLPAVEFGFRSFEMAFGQPDITPNFQFDDKPTMDKVQELLSKGLDWATAPEEGTLNDTPEWSAIVDALAKLAPPQTGIVETVEISGSLTGRRRKPLRLTRKTSDRIASARKRLKPNKISLTHEGDAREFDKDKLTFILRDGMGKTIWPVVFSQEQYDDVYLAFDSNKLVNVVVYATATPPHELVSITFSAPPLDATLE